MKHYPILLAMVVGGTGFLACGGCNFMHKEKVRSYKEWHQARSQIICSVGEEHFKAGSLDKAQSCAVESLSMNSDYLPARMLLAKVLLGSGRYEEAAKQLQEAEALLANLKPDARQGGSMGAEIAYLRGEALERSGKYAEALQCYQKCRALDPSNDAYVMASAEVLVSMGRPKGALELLEVRLQRIEGGDPSDGGSMLILAGEVAMLAGDYARATDFFQQCLDMSNDRNSDKPGRSVRESLAKAHFFAGNYRQAIESLKQVADNVATATGSEPSSCWARIMMGDSYMALNRPRDAKAEYESAVAIEPGDWPLWLALAKAAVADGDARRGITAGLRAMELAESPVATTTAAGNKGRLEISVVTAHAMLMENRPEDAMKVLAPSARENPNDPMLWCMLGRCYSAKGQTDRAAACYMAALRAAPDSPVASLAKNLLACIEEKK